MYTLVGVNENAFAIMGYTQQAMRECGKTPVEVKAYQTEVMNGNYEELIVASVDILEDLNMLTGNVEEDDYDY